MDDFVKEYLDLMHDLLLTYTTKGIHNSGQAYWLDCAVWSLAKERGLNHAAYKSDNILVKMGVTDDSRREHLDKFQFALSLVTSDGNAWKMCDSPGAAAVRARLAKQDLEEKGR